LPLLLTSLWLVRWGPTPVILLCVVAILYNAYWSSYTVLRAWLPPLYLVYVAIVSMSVYNLIFVLVSTDADVLRSRFSARAPVRWAGGFLMVMSLLLATMWVVMIVGH